MDIQKQPPRGVLKKSVLKICSKFTGEHLCRRVILIKMQSNSSAWVLCCKFAAYFQNTFSYEHLWVAASGYTVLNFCQFHCVKSVQIQSLFWSVRIQENTDQKKLLCGHFSRSTWLKNCGNYGLMWNNIRVSLLKLLAISCTKIKGKDAQKKYTVRTECNKNVQELMKKKNV